MLLSLSLARALARSLTDCEPLDLSPVRRRRQAVYAAINKIAEDGLSDCIVFAEVACNTAQKQIRFKVVDTNSCWAQCGAVETTINLGWCDSTMYTGSVIHEIGHAIALGHEHKRPDRDQYITVNFTNIAPDWVSQYSIDPSMTMAHSYNYNSLMHYGSGCTGYGQSRRCSITQPAGTPPIGRHSGGFDANDMEQIRDIYECRTRPPGLPPSPSPARPCVNSANTGFNSPYNTCASLASFCNHDEYGPSIRYECPVTCCVSPCCSPPAVAPPGGGLSPPSIRPPIASPPSISPPVASPPSPGASPPVARPPSPGASPSPALSPPVASCPAGTSNFPVQLFTQNWGSEISFKIDGVTITSGTLGNFQTYTYMRCLAPGSHTLLLQDSFGDGWHGGYVRINNVNYGTTFTSGASMTFTFNV